jgi:hypothetical protein
MDSDEIRIGLIVTAITGAALLELIGFCMVLAYAEGSYSCPRRWAGTYETEFSAFGGCRVKVDGKWWPESRYRYVEINK